MKILVTGGAGYIGSHFIKELKNNGYKSEDLLIVDNLSNGSEKNIILGKLIQADLRNKEEIEKIVSDYKPDLIVHFAAFISVSESVSDPIKYYENNFVGSLNLINAAIKNNVKKFIFSSTAAVYGTPKTSNITEDLILTPINPYGNSKKMVEELLRDIKASNPEFNYIILRYFNVAGNDPEMIVGNRQKKYENLISILLNNIKHGNNKINIFGNDWNTPDKTCIRDYIHVTDLAKAHISVMTILEKNKTETFNVGYGTGYSVLEVVNAIEKETNVKIEKVFVERRIGDPESVIANNSKIKTLTNWNPKYNDLNIIIKTAWQWMKNIP